MEKFEDRLARDHRIIEVHGDAAWPTPETLWNSVCNHLINDDSFKAKKLILQSICSAGLFNRSDVAEASFAAQSGHERTPTIGRDFSNGADMKTVVAQFRSEKRQNGRRGCYDLVRRRAKIADINKPGGLVVLVDMAEIKCVSRTGKPVTQAFLAIPPIDYVKWVKDSRGDTVQQSSLTLDFNEYGEVCGSRSEYQLDSFEELCKTRITQTGIIKPRTVIPSKLVVEYTGPMWDYSGTTSDLLS
jgi:hypothetical protein